MKFLIALLLLLPTLISILLFTVAGFAYNNPAMLAASTNPIIAILCIVAGVIAVLPLIVVIGIGIINLLTADKKKKEKDEKKS